jgi:hypothetical protein
METATYYRIERADLDHDRLLLPEHQRSTIWVGWVQETCEECRGEGEAWITDDDCWDTCPSCSGFGCIDKSEQEGVSCCQTIAGLIEYFRSREAAIDEHVIVEMIGVETGERDYDADAGAVLIRPTTIVSITPLDPSLISAGNPIYEETP